MDTFLITNARLTSSGERVFILVEQGRIKSLSSTCPSSLAEGMPVLDAADALLFPGLYDMHAHLGQPGHDARETIKCATEAAINGGVTGVCAMPDTRPAVDCAPVVRLLSDLISAARIPVQLAGCITEKAEGEQQASYGNLAALGIKFLTDGDKVPANPLLLRRAMQYAGEMGLTFAMRGDTEELTRNAVAHESTTSYALGLAAAPACAEEMGIFHIMALATDADTALHIQTMSTRGSVETYRARKNRGRFTAEVALHHLIFSHEDIGDLDTNMKTIPPLRDKADTEALLEAVNEGLIDCIVTDHTPCTPFEKLQDFCSTPAGMISLDTFLPALYTHLVKPGKLSWETLIQCTSTNPRRIMGLPTAELKEGAAADFVLFQPEENTEVTADFLRSKARNTPWLNQSLAGKVVLVCKNSVLKNELSQG